MFDNRFYRWKLGGSLALIAVMGVYAADHGQGINPMLWRCVAEPARWKDTPVWIPLARVVRVGSTDFDISTGDPQTEIRVVGRSPGQAGERVSLRGIFRAEGPRLDLVAARKIPPHFRFRWLMEGVSLVVGIAVLVNFRRAFQLKLDHLQLWKEL